MNILDRGEPCLHFQDRQPTKVTSTQRVARYVEPTRSNYYACGKGTAFTIAETTLELLKVAIGDVPGK
jgi:hypothetical protein